MVKETFKSFGSNVNLKIDFISEYIASGGLTTYYIKLGGFITLSIILAFVASMVIDKMSKYQKPSVIIMSQADEIRRDEINKKYDMKFLKYFGSIVIALIINLASSYIYSIVVSSGK